MSSRRVSPKRIVPEDSLSDPNRSVVIITSRLSGVKSIEKYLHNRKWNAKIVVGSLSQGLQVATIYNATYLIVDTELVPLDTSNLFEALKKSFQLILYAPKPDAHALRLRERYGPVCIAPLTGPLIERLILESGPSRPHTPRAGDHSDEQILRLVIVADRALSEICVPHSREPIRTIGKRSKFHCFAVQSGAICGYIVLGKSGELDNSLSERLRLKVCEGLMASEGFFRAGDLQEITLREVQLEGLAMAEGDFYRKADHLGDEVAIAMFRIDDIDISIAESADRHWLAAPLRELTPGETIDFDLYLYLPTNQKFVLFRRAGEIVNENETERLKTHGISDVHLRREALSQFYGYKSKAFLNALIWNFQQDNTEVTSAS